MRPIDLGTLPAQRRVCARPSPGGGRRAVLLPITGDGGTCSPKRYIQLSVCRRQFATGWQWRGSWRTLGIDVGGVNKSIWAGGVPTSWVGSPSRGWTQPVGRPPRPVTNTQPTCAIGIVETLNCGDFRVDETELVRTPISWIFSRRFICAVRRHPTEVRLTRYGDGSTRPIGTVSRCPCGRSSRLMPPQEGM